VVPRASLDAVEKREVCCVWLESDLGSSVVQSVALLTDLCCRYLSLNLTFDLDMRIVIFVPVLIWNLFEMEEYSGRKSNVFRDITPSSLLIVKPMFRRNITPPSSGSKNKMSKKPA
jgi:hypothetical protein